MSKETRAVKFYLDENSIKLEDRQKINQFMEECRLMENNLLEYYWNHFEDVIKAYNNKNFYDNRIPMPEPRLKFHHYMNILFQVYESLKSIQSNIINNRMNFKFKEDKEKQKIYNYCKGFCFDWNRLEKYIDKQIKLYKKKDKSYYEFLVSINEIIGNKENYKTLKQEIEAKFWEVKNTINQPIKHNCNIKCTTFHTVDINKSNENKWIFTIDNNNVIGGTPKKAKFGVIIIPVKLSDYHKEILNHYELANTFNIKVNTYGKLEVIGCYEKEIEYPQPQEITNYVGIDIGLNKLITSSEGEVIEQNPIIVKKLEKIVNKQANRQSLEEHLKIKYQDENFKLPDKNYVKMQNRLTRFVTCDNRYRLKQFVKSCAITNSQIIMEDLDLHEVKTHSKKINNMMKRLHIHRIKSDIIKYSKENGVKVALINPAFTSQQCPICGCIDKRNRATQETFKCINCEHEANADYNASINIKSRYFDDRIKPNTPFWKIKELLNVV